MDFFYKHVLDCLQLVGIKLTETPAEIAMRPTCIALHSWQVLCQFTSSPCRHVGTGAYEAHLYFFWWWCSEAISEQNDTLWHKELSTRSRSPPTIPSRWPSCTQLAASEELSLSRGWTLHIRLPSGPVEGTSVSSSSLFRLIYRSSLIWPCKLTPTLCQIENSTSSLWVWRLSCYCSCVCMHPSTWKGLWTRLSSFRASFVLFFVCHYVSLNLLRSLGKAVVIHFSVYHLTDWDRDVRLPDLRGRQAASVITCSGV